MVKSHKHLYLVWCLGSVAFSGTMLMRLFHLLYLIALLYPGFQNNQLRLVLLEASIMLIRRWVYRIIKTVLFVKTKKLKGINLKGFKNNKTILILNILISHKWCMLVKHLKCRSSNFKIPIAHNKIKILNQNYSKKEDKIIMWQQIKLI